MTRSLSRRAILRSAATTSAALGLGELSFLSALPPIQDSLGLDASVVRFDSGIEPLVRLLEETPREKLLEVFAARIQAGTTYNEVLTALLLAGIRNIPPRPDVGWKFHAVLVLNSAHLASQAATGSQRWLPIFWALDEFKNSQARDVREGNWTMGKVDEARVPPAHKARAAFIDAMERWDVEAADVAVAGLARTAPSHELFELFARYGARDFRSIGHKAIFVANSWRALQSIGWGHAEPVLRSLAYALLNHNGQPNPADSDLDADRPWRENVELANSIGKKWRGGKTSADATGDLIETLRGGSAADASEKVVELLAKGFSERSVYDGLLLGSAELLMRQPGIVALHSMTTSNALRYNFATTENDDTRRMLLLQNAAFVPLFREAMKGRGEVGEATIDGLEAADSGDAVLGLEPVFDAIGKDRHSAAGGLLGHLDGGADPREFIDGARRLIFLKGTNSHDYKFSSAVLEDFYHISPEWRNRYLAASVFNLRGSSHKDNPLVKRARTALG